MTYILQLLSLPTPYSIHIVHDILLMTRLLLNIASKQNEADLIIKTNKHATTYILAIIIHRVYLIDNVLPCNMIEQQNILVVHLLLDSTSDAPHLTYI